VSDDGLVQQVLNCRVGSVVAPAGCGKTDSIADAVKAAGGRFLVLTHTLAGVDSLRKRLKEKEASPKLVDLETIAGWSLKFAGAFPLRSGLVTREPKGKEWRNVYEATSRLVGGGFITSVLKSSYKGVLVDEYQDCTVGQHELIVALSKHLPVCIFGDPLQAIFGFGGDTLIKWNEVETAFPQVGKLKVPWRWNRVQNWELGKWLIGARDQLETGGQVDLSNAPHCVKCISPESSSKDDIRKANVKAALRPELIGDETLIVIGDKTSEMRASLASKTKCTSIEPVVVCKSLAKFIAGLSSASGNSRLRLVLDFAQNIMTGVKKTPFERRVHKLSAGWLAGKARTDAEQAALDILASDDLKAVLSLLEALRRKVNAPPYRRELLSATCNALKLVVAAEQENLESAVWHVQNKVRHAGRRSSKRSVGSTLLVKGLQFDHAVITAPGKLSKNDLYVALTRASRTITIVSGGAVLKPKAG